MRAREQAGLSSEESVERAINIFIRSIVAMLTHRASGDQRDSKAACESEQ